MDDDTLSLRLCVFHNLYLANFSNWQNWQNVFSYFFIPECETKTKTIFSITWGKKSMGIWGGAHIQGKSLNRMR